MAPEKSKNRTRPKSAPQSKKPQARRAHTEVFLEPSTEKQEHHPIKLPPQMVRALAINRPNPGMTSTLSYIRTKQDVFYGALLAHFLDESLHYSLPGIEHPWNQYATYWGSYTVSGTTTATSLAPAQQAGAGYALPSTTLQQAYNSSRYGVFQGSYQSEPSFTTDANGKLYLWAFFNPLEYDYPVKFLNMADPTNPALEANSFAASWFDNPFVMAVNWNSLPSSFEKGTPSQAKPPSDHDCYVYEDYERVPSARPRDKPASQVGITPTAQATSDIDEWNLYYTGGAALTINCMKTDETISVAMRARTVDNVVNRFYQGVDNIYVNDQLGFSVPYTNTFSAHAFHSGNQWDFLTRGKGGVIPGSAANQNLYGVKAFQKAWQVGSPFIQIVVQTTTPNTAVRFSVGARAWVGVAPMRLASAGAMPLETAPFRLPSWFSFARSGAGYGKLEQAHRSSANAQIMNMLPALTSEVPLLRQVSSSPNPRQAIETIAAHPRVAQHNGVETVVEGVGAGAIGNWLYNKVGPYAKTLLGNRAKQLAGYVGGKVLPFFERNALPMLEEAAVFV